MKKNNNDKTKDLFSSFLPDRDKDEPNGSLKKEKKLYSTIFIIICSLLLVGNLLAMIINFATLDIRGGLISLFVGFINCVIMIFLLGLLIVLSHNISKITRATLFMCDKLLKDEKRYLSEQRKKEEDSLKEDNLKKEEKEEESFEESAQEEEVTILKQSITFESESNGEQDNFVESEVVEE